MITISSGKTHDKINTLVMAGVLALGVASNSYPLMFSGLGIGIGTVFLSPDLDLPKSNPTNRLGPFKSLLMPYRLLCGHHRSIVSHSPVLSSLIRVAYFMAPIVIWCVLNDKQDTLTKVTLSPGFFWTLVGLEIATDLHLFLDFQSSYFKKIRKV